MKKRFAFIYRIGQKEILDQQINLTRLAIDALDLLRRGQPLGECIYSLLRKGNRIEEISRIRSYLKLLYYSQLKGFMLKDDKQTTGQPSGSAKLTRGVAKEGAEVVQTQ